MPGEDRPVSRLPVPSSARSLEELTLMVKVLAHDQTSVLHAAAAVVDAVVHGEPDLSVDHRDGLCAVGDDLRGLAEEAAGLLSDLVAGTDGWAAPRWEAVAMDDLVSAVVRDFSLRTDHRIVAHLAPVEVVANGELVSRGIRNLVGNVMQHTPATTTVDVTVSTDGLAAEVTVADDGPGIPDALKDVVFQPFTHADGWRASSGLGLGLSLVRAVADHHGGAIELRDRPGGGSVFVFRIPVRGRGPSHESSGRSSGPTTAATR